MRETVKCPVCQNSNVETCFYVTDPELGGPFYECIICGKFKVLGAANNDLFQEFGSNLTRNERAVLSHHLRLAQDGKTTPTITSDWLKKFRSNARLPSPAIQAANIVRLVGDHIAQTGKRLERFPPEFVAVIGSPSWEFANDLAYDLVEQKTLVAGISSSRGTQIWRIGLTLQGWQQYEAERHGKISGDYGFIAMKFNDPDLDPFVRDIVRPTIKKGIGYDLIDMRDVSEAGIVDNIMRTRIRDSAFVVVELTHGNRGAYWEAGYAEGLGKPVLYMCKKSVFESEDHPDRPHFDTNHCTTVLWGEDDEKFKEQIVATLRRSLNLFPK